MASPAEWHPQTRDPRSSTCGPDGIDDDSVLSVLRRVAIRISHSPRLESAVKLVAEVVPCDSCFIYVLEGSELVLKPLVVEVKELVALGVMGLWGMQLQLLKRLGDRIEAGGVERLDDGGSLRQPSLRRNDEV